MVSGAIVEQFFSALHLKSPFSWWLPEAMFDCAPVYYAPRQLGARKYGQVHMAENEGGLPPQAAVSGGLCMLWGIPRGKETLRPK